MDGGAWQTTVHGVAKSWTQLSDLTYLLKVLNISLLLQPVKNPPAMQETLV